MNSPLPYLISSFGPRGGKLYVLSVGPLVAALILAFGISGTLLHVAEGRTGFGTFVGVLAALALGLWVRLLVSTWLYTARRRS